ncbi:MAG TPA: urate hydroxylase PuuD [Candidatus Sulfotelmatobacter sp.]|nr:urate hydroxylase PuuD [Candidatus Sulfotelmatobacter sp.]
MIGGYVLDWLNLIFRWAHLIAGISWIGASFYFVWLDDSLRLDVPDGERERGVYGALWSVHGGGFYHNRKFPTGPRGEPLSDDLHWFYWEAYSTWITGMAMLAIIYWAGASTYLIDPSVLVLTPWQAISISIGVLVAGYLVYDGLCRVFENQPIALWTSICAALLFADWGLFHVFGGRAAYIHVGAIIGTIMVANVGHVIIPGQRRVVAQLRRGETPDPRPGKLGKMRSVHNTYFTLPVLFIMISNHYPMTYGSSWGWLILALIAAAGVLVRRFFVLSHKHRLIVALPVTAAVILAVAGIILVPHPPAAVAGAAAPTWTTVQPILAQRCAVCHAAHPTEPGFTAPPEGVLLDSAEHAHANAARIREQAVTTHAMPLGNVTHITDAERATLGAWIAAGAPVP